jgi:ketosteroid isomerase-like protein
MKLLIRTVLVLFASLALFSGVYADSENSTVSADNELLQADLAWSKTVGVENKDAFFGSMLSDVALLAPHQPIAEGIKAVSTAFKGMFGLPGFGLTWQPTSAELSGSGNIGYTIGTYELKFDGPDGKQVVDNGKYMTVWKKQADGTWKVAVDMFNTNMPLPSN